MLSWSTRRSSLLDLLHLSSLLWTLLERNSFLLDSMAIRIEHCLETCHSASLSPIPSLSCPHCVRIATTARTHPLHAVNVTRTSRLSWGDLQSTNRCVASVIIDRISSVCDYDCVYDYECVYADHPPPLLPEVQSVQNYGRDTYWHLSASLTLHSHEVPPLWLQTVCQE